MVRIFPRAPVTDCKLNLTIFLRGVASLTSCDDVVDGFVTNCLANPEYCPLAKNQSAEALSQTLEDIFYSVKANPVHVETADGLQTITYTKVKLAFYWVLNSPPYWSSLSYAFNSLLGGDAEAFWSWYEWIGFNQLADEAATFATRFGDSKVRINALSDLDPLIPEAVRASKWFGYDLASDIPVLGGRWRQRTKEPPPSDFRVQTKNPMLFVNLAHDIKTPLASARKMSQDFAGSGLLVNNGYGVSDESFYFAFFLHKAQQGRSI